MNALGQIFLWLAIFAACILPASALTSNAPENYIWEIFSIGYDATTAEVIDLGHRAATSISDYHTAPIHSVITEKVSTETTRSLFGPSAEFKAAKGFSGFE